MRKDQIRLVSFSEDHTRPSVPSRGRQGRQNANLLHVTTQMSFETYTE